MICGGESPRGKPDLSNKGSEEMRGKSGDRGKAEEREQREKR